ncbi:head completion/stabilization protein [Gallibacterium sp. AGMB14963]|uniref:head completion/stabilization protein n=1 Tax=Gallibacterium faecale TaxID=3019086 RepID=UPI0022F19CC2|nr:head completion/stabilization protein [Gallibacterium sp. AGMB14963]MDA3979033.1 head completion/stabilization protein [Gallibacterium sp. AGMB14963]
MLNGNVTEYQDEVIESTGFWGNINIAEFQKQRAIPFQIPLEMVRAVLVQAMQEMEIELAEVAEKYQLDGYQYAENISGVRFDGDNFLQIQYKKAVFARAKADLLPEFMTLSVRDVHENRDLVQERKALLTEATMAIRAIKGKKRSGVWLV